MRRNLADAHEKERKNLYDMSMVAANEGNVSMLVQFNEMMKNCIKTIELDGVSLKDLRTEIDQLKR